MFYIIYKFYPCFKERFRWMMMGKVGTNNVPDTSIGPQVHFCLISLILFLICSIIATKRGGSISRCCTQLVKCQKSWGGIWLFLISNKYFCFIFLIIFLMCFTQLQNELTMFQDAAPSQCKDIKLECYKLGSGIWLFLISDDYLHLIFFNFFKFLYVLYYSYEMS